MCSLHLLHQSTSFGFLKTTSKNPLPYYNLKFSGLHFRRRKRYNFVPIKATMGEGEDSDGFSGFSSFDDYADSEGISGGNFYIMSSSGEESDADVVLNPIGDVDLPSTNERFESSDGALAVTAHRFGMLRRRGKTNRNAQGLL
ncbi:hypothetical protein IFM89_011766 [Coptis chinensis]|uniref:Uncharacterized protein n=1 Tax=Coptis chinensis TaxID=261450 RepID=A0A835M5G7_9MAGN|nr:hypothetical protein IFM89_011766 [Coptis chinensis]